MNFVSQLERTAALQQKIESARERDGHDVDSSAPLTSARILLAAQDLLLYHWQLSLPQMVPLGTDNLVLMAFSSKFFCDGTSKTGCGGFAKAAEGQQHDQESFLAREVHKLRRCMQDILSSVPPPQLDDDGAEMDSNDRSSPAVDLEKSRAGWRAMCMTLGRLCERDSARVLEGEMGDLGNHTIQNGLMQMAMDAFTTKFADRDMDVQKHTVEAMGELAASLYHKLLAETLSLGERSAGAKSVGARSSGGNKLASEQRKVGAFAPLLELLRNAEGGSMFPAVVKLVASAALEAPATHLPHLFHILRSDDEDDGGTGGSLASSSSAEARAVPNAALTASSVRTNVKVSICRVLKLIFEDAHVRNDVQARLLREELCVALIASLGHVNISVRQAVCSVFPVLDPTHVLPRLCWKVTDPSAVVRSASAKALELLLVRGRDPVANFTALLDCLRNKQVIRGGRRGDEVQPNKETAGAMLPASGDPNGGLRPIQHPGQLETGQPAKVCPAKNPKTETCTAKLVDQPP